MITRDVRRAPRGPALLALLLVLAVAPNARAFDADGSDQTDEGWKKVLSYGRCAFEVFKAANPVEWTAAFLDCTRLFLAEPPLPGSQP